MTEWLSSGYQRDAPRDIGVIINHTMPLVAYASGSAPAPKNAPQHDWSNTVLSAAARRFASYAELVGKKSTNNAAAPVMPAPDTNWMEAASGVIVDEVIEHVRNVAPLEFYTSLHPP